ncbi:MAG: asparagine synthetase B, partial [Sphingomonadaceae bacterium]
MCGFAGSFALAAGSSITRAELDAMVAPLHHRGPDATASWQDADGRSGLAHARLAIIDLSGGRQPMEDSSGDVVLAFNGEIFNFVELREELEGRGHRFRTNSDTEVLLAAYVAWG